MSGTKIAVAGIGYVGLSNAVRGLMPEGAESYAKPFSATCIRQ